MWKRLIYHIIILFLLALSAYLILSTKHGSQVASMICFMALFCLSAFSSVAMERELEALKQQEIALWGRNDQ